MNNGSILTHLQDAQVRDGYITREAVAEIASLFKVSVSKVYGVATFYHQFTFRPKGKIAISVCTGTACFVLGAQDILTAVENEIGIKAGQTTEDGLFSIEDNTRCLGDCASAPIATVGDAWIRKATVRQVLAEIRKQRFVELQGIGGKK